MCDDEFVFVVSRERWPNPRPGGLDREQIATFFGENAQFSSAMFCRKKIWQDGYRWWVSRECISRSKEAAQCHRP